MLNKREQTEVKLMWILDLLIEEYHKYNPEGGYLSISYREEDGEVYKSIYNGYFMEGSIDEGLKIDVSSCNNEMRSN